MNFYFMLFIFLLLFCWILIFIIIIIIIIIIIFLASIAELHSHTRRKQNAKCVVPTALTNTPTLPELHTKNDIIIVM